MGNTVIQGNISVYGGKVFIDDKPMHPCPASDTSNVVIINKRVYISGYELVDGQWEHTLKALWYKYFD